VRGGGKGSSRSTIKGSRFLQKKKKEIWQTEAFDTLYAWSSDSPTNLHCRSVIFMHVLHCLKQEKVKGDRVNFPYRLYSVGNPSLGSEIPESQK